MNPEFSLGKIRKIAETLKRVPVDRSTPYNATVAPQEVLDYLAMLAGIKPVYLLGRGFGDPAWVRGILRLSSEHGLFMLRGDALEPPTVETGIPAWYTEHLERKTPRAPVVYITKSRAAGEEIGGLMDGGEISHAGEARLFGFPECCVAAHHALKRAVDRAEYELVRRVAGGEEARMRQILDNGEPVTPESDEERRALEPDWVLCPFTSFFMCDACRDGEAGPARKISGRQMRFAKKVDKALYGVIAEIVRISPAYRLKDETETAADGD